jgi:hypothetical protein
VTATEIKRPDRVIQQAKIHDVQHWPQYWAADLLEWIDHLEAEVDNLKAVQRHLESETKP